MVNICEPPTGKTKLEGRLKVIVLPFSVIEDKPVKFIVSPAVPVTFIVKDWAPVVKWRTVGVEAEIVNGTALAKLTNSNDANIPKINKLIVLLFICDNSAVTTVYKDLYF